jgi:hypothetical protein
VVDEPGVQSPSEFAIPHRTYDRQPQHRHDDTLVVRQYRREYADPDPDANPDASADSKAYADSGLHNQTLPEVLGHG